SPSWPPEQSLAKAVLEMGAILRRHDEAKRLDHHLGDTKDRALLGAQVLHKLGDFVLAAYGAGIGNAAAFGNHAEIGAGARLRGTIVARAGVRGLVAGLAELF